MNEIEKTFIEYIFEINKRHPCAEFESENKLIICYLAGISDDFKPPLLNIIYKDKSVWCAVDCQYKIDKYRADFVLLFSDFKYVIEIDGHNFHEKTKEQVANDKKRERKLLQLGYRVVRFSGSEVYNNCGNCWLELFQIIIADKEGKNV